MRLRLVVRWLLGIVGLASQSAGAVAVFATDREAGPVALVGVGAVMLLIGASGRMPDRVKWGDREAEWSREVEQSRERIAVKAEVLADAWPAEADPLIELATGGGSPKVGSQAQLSLVREVQQLQRKAGPDAVPAQALLELARYHLATQDWAEAVRYLEMYTNRVEADWEAYFSLGVANANQRTPSTDRAALRAYDEAMARLPTNSTQPLTARLYSYRSAIKKRLGRISEAWGDAHVAKQLAESRYDRIDATYNLACAEAMLGHRDLALIQLRELESLGGISMVVPHTNDYFASLADDAEFRALLGGRAEMS